MLGVIESVALVLEVSIILVLLANLFDKHLKVNVYTIVIVLVYLFIFKAINSGDFPTFTALLAYASIFVYGLFIYKKSVRITLINFFLSFVIGCLLQLVLSIPVYYVYNKEIGIMGLNALLVNAICMLIVAMASKKVRLKRISDFIQQRSWIIKFSFLFIIIYIIINTFYMKLNSNIENADYIQMIFFAILFFLAINEWQKAITDAERKRTQLEMNKLYYDAYDELLLLIRERQHDMKNHINAILGMIYTVDNYEDLVEKQRKYCDEVIAQNKETKLLLSIGNPLIAGFLYRKYQEAQRQEIFLECKVAAKDDNYYIPEYEMIEMLGVLLDNAIDALRDAIGLEKKIFVAIEDYENIFRVLVANCSRYYDPEEICRFFQKDYSSKGKGLGIGLTKLKRIVEEKDGDIMATNEIIDGNNYLQFNLIFTKKK